MKEDIVTPETANLAKDIGFNEIVSGGYTPKGVYHGDIGFQNNSEGIVISAPTQSFLHKWLMEKYKIYINITEWNYGNKWYFEFRSLDDTLYSNHELINFLNKRVNERKELYEFNEYKDALEVGMQELIHLIKERL